MFDISTAFYSLSTAKKSFPKLKDPILSNQNSGVYKSQCPECPAHYIGQTGRKLKTRVSEHNPSTHLNASRYENENESHFAIHHNYKRKFDGDSASLIHEKNNERRCVALENIKIVKANLNKQN